MGTGRFADPMTFDEVIALDLPENSVIHMAPGTYSSRKTLTKTQHLIFKPTIPGSRVIFSDGYYLTGSNMTFEEIEIFDHDFTDRESVQEVSSPTDINGTLAIADYGVKNRFINCIIHDGFNGYSTGYNPTLDGAELYGCLVFYNGWKVTPSHSWGHGIYPRNIGNYQFKIEECISFNNFGLGICPGSNGYDPISDLDNFLIRGNIMFENGILCGNAYRANFMMHCPLESKNNIIEENISFTGSKIPVTDWAFHIGEIANQPVDASVKNNVIVSSGKAVELHNVNGEVSGNTIVGTITGFTQADYPNNAYLQSYAGVHVRPNKYKVGRGNIAIFNPSAANSVEVDLSPIAYLAPGQIVKVHNVEDYFNDIQTLTIGSNGKIIVDMQAVNRTVQTPVGWEAPSTVFPHFGAFVVEKE